MKAKQTEDVYKYAIIDGGVKECKVLLKLSLGKVLVSYNYESYILNIKEDVETIVSENMLFDTEKEANIQIRIESLSTDFEIKEENINKSIKELEKDLNFKLWFAVSLMIIFLLTYNL